MDRKNKLCLADNLTRLIAQRKLSLHMISAKTGVNKSTLHNYLNGVTPQGIHSLLKLCDYFDVDLEDLLFSQNRISKGKVLDKERTSLGEKYEIIIKKIID